jgi:hypothetical protein
MARAVSKVRKTKAKPKTRKTKAKTAKTKKSNLRRAAAAPAPALTCVDFGPVPDDTHYGSSFVRARFSFKLLPGASPRQDLFVNATGGGKGLQFPNGGMDVRLPAPATKVAMRVGVWGPPFTIKAYNTRGSVVGSAVASKRNAYGNLDIVSTRRDIVGLEFVGGGDDGILVKLCSKA